MASIRSSSFFCLLLAVCAASLGAQSTYKAPRTPDGQPDLQGYWTNLTYTPFERPKDLANKPFYTEKEAIDAFNKAVEGSENQVVHYVNTDFGATPVQTGAQPNLRTSLVIDPPDGRIPPMTPGAQKREAARIAEQRAGGPLARTWRDDRGTVWCVFHDRAVPAVTAPYGSNYQIVQSKDYIVMIYEWNSERRVISLNGHPHGAVPLYAGDSRGHWEGDTLVVDTVNFNPKRTFMGSPGTPPAVSVTPTFHLTERFTRAADDAITHTYTVEDPATWTRPWTVEMPLHRMKGPMLEYACNENNVDAFTTLRNARLQEAGKLAPPGRVRNVDDPKATVIQREETGAGKAGGAGEVGKAK
jgi:hypothetical protein